MKRSHLMPLLTLVAFTFFSLIGGEFIFDLHASAQKTCINKDGTQTTSEPDNTYGEGGTKETVRDAKGRVIKVVKRDKEGKPRTSSTYFCGDKECGSDAMWVYDSKGRLVSFVISYSGLPLLPDGSEKRTITYTDDADKKGTAKDEVYDPETHEGKPATASQTEFINSASGPDPIHDYSPDKPESIVGDLGRADSKPSPSPSPGPARSPKFKLGLDYKFDFKSSPGLNTETFTLPNGSKIIVNLPDDMSAGDTITGSVQTEVAAKDERQRARYRRELDKVVLVIGGQPVSAAEKMFTRTIQPNVNAETPFIVVMVNDKQACSTTMPSPQSTSPVAQTPQLPTCGQMGRNVVVMDHCDGIIAPTDSCTIGGTQLQPLAESPRMRVLQNTSQTAGQTEIRYSEQGNQVSGPFMNLGVNLSSPNTNLLRNQKTTMEVVALVAGIQQDVSLDLVNDTPGIVSISGGDNQHFIIHPADVRADGTYHQNFSVMANQAGAWGATATVSCVGAGPSGPVAGGPQGTASPSGAVRPGVPLIPPPTPTPSPGGHPPASPTPTPSPSPSPCCPISLGTYTITNLGTLPPPDPTNYGISVGINDSQDTVGGSHGKLAPVASEAHAFSIYPLDSPLIAKNDLSWPSLPAGGVGSFAYGVNASGHVVGNWYIPPAPLAFTYPFLFDGSKMLNLPTPPYPEGSGQAFGINIHDDVVGIAASGKPSIAAIYPIGWAALWPSKDHSMININTLLPPGSGWKLTAAYGINDAGHIVGKGEHFGAIHAFLWLGSGIPIDLGTLPGGDHSVAFGLNSTDAVVGYSNLKKGGGTIHGFVWKDGVIKDIGIIPPYTNSVAQAINEKGCVIGDTFLPTLYKPIFEGGSTAPISHGVLYNDGVLIDVNTLMTADSAWELKTANDINDDCQIVGAGNYKGSKYLTAYVLSPPGVALTSGLKPGMASARCALSAPSGTYIFDNWNICGVKNGPTKDTTFTIDAPYLITFIATYHWNDGKGALPGSKGISLKDSSGKVFGPWSVTTSAGSGGKANVNWECHPGITLPAGTYTIIDPDPATWSQNDGSHNIGFVRVAGSPKK